MSLTEADILASHAGSADVGAGGTTTATLTGGSDPGWTGTQEGSIILLAVGTSATLSTPAGFTRATETPAATSPTALYWKKATAGETGWTISSSSAATLDWYVEEWQPGALDPDFPVDVVNTSPGSTNSGTGATATTRTTPTSTSYDVVAYALFHGYHSSSTTPPTISGHGGGYSEVASVTGAGAARSVRLSVARQFSQRLAAFTGSATVAGHTNWNAAQVVLTAAEAKKAASLAGFRGWHHRTVAGLAAGVAPICTAAVGPAFTDHALLGPALRFAMTAQAKYVQWLSTILGNPGSARALVWHFPFVLESLSSDMEITRGGVNSAGQQAVVRYRAASGKLTLQLPSGTEVESTLSPAVDTRYELDVRVSGPATAWTARWQIDGIEQPQATGTGATAMTAGHLTVGSEAAATGTLVVGDVIWSFIGGHFPLGPFKLVALKVDPAATPTNVGTVGNFALITNNATGAALTAGTLANARDAVDDIPPTIGTGADGVCQTAAAASDYIQFPLETYTPAITELVRAGLLYTLGWGAGAAPVAASIGVRGWDGSVETQLLVAANTTHGFGNSTTDPGWHAALWTPAGGWTQPKIDAAAVRLGFSSDATPDIGAQAFLLLLAMQLTKAEQVFGDVVTADVDPASEGIQRLHVDTTGIQGGTLGYTIGGSETTVRVEAGQTHTEVIQAADLPTIEKIRFQLDPEPAG